MTESDLMRSIMIALSAAGALIFRNNVGVLPDRRGIPVRFGLHPGSADLIGCYKSRFVAIEIKLPGKKARPEQDAFLSAVRKHGGIAGVATSIEEALALLK